MGYIVSFLILIIGIMLQNNKKTWASPDVLFCYLWGIVCLAASFGFYGLYETSLKTWLIILIGVISFCVGAKFTVTFGVKSNRSIDSDDVLIDSFYYFSARIFWLLFVIVAILMVIELRTSIQLLQQGYSLAMIRDASYGMAEIAGYTAKSSSLEVLLGYIRSAIQVILIATGIEYFYNDMKHNKKYLVASLFIVLADTFTDGGRWGIVYFAVEFLVCFNLLKGQNKSISSMHVSKRMKRRIIAVVLVMLIIMIWVTKARWGGDIWQHFYVYLCGCVPYFDIRNAELCRDGFISFFYAGLNGLWSLILPTIHNWTGIGFDNFYQTMDCVMTTQKVVNIADGQTFNAFITCFWFLYADFRWIGLCFGMFIFGIGSNTVYNNTKTTIGTRSVAPYLIITQMIIKSIQIYPLASSMYVFVFVFMVIIHIMGKKPKKY